MSNRIEMTGQELWELVWSMPLTRAAATFQMSHLALKRLFEMVVPTGGAEGTYFDHWSSRHGRPVTRRWLSRPMSAWAKARRLYGLP